MGNKQSYDVQHSSVVVDKGEIRKVDDNPKPVRKDSSRENVQPRTPEVEDTHLTVVEVAVDVPHGEEEDHFYAVPEHSTPSPVFTSTVVEESITLQNTHGIGEEEMENSAMKMHALHRILPLVESPLDKEPTQSCY